MTQRTQDANERFESWIGRELKDASGHKIGQIEDMYTDDDTGKPEWLAVNTGHFGSNVSLVPLHGASSDGDDIRVDFPKDQVKEAPNAGADGRLSESEEARLYAHYGLDYDQERVRLQRSVGPDSGSTRRVARVDGSDDILGRDEVGSGHDRAARAGWATDEELARDEQPVRSTLANEDGLARDEQPVRSTLANEDEFVSEPRPSARRNLR